MKSVDKIDPLHLPYAGVYPRQYVALRAPPPPHPSTSSSFSSFDKSSGSLPAATATTIDGDLDKPFWTDVDWTDDFVDIATETSPGFRTKAKMRWDDEFLYVGGWVGVPTCCLTGRPLVFFLSQHRSRTPFPPPGESPPPPPPCRCILGELATGGILASISFIDCVEADPVPSFFSRRRRVPFVRYYSHLPPSIGRDGRVGDAHGTQLGDFSRQRCECNRKFGYVL
jgi:hypothetical protein